MLEKLCPTHWQSDPHILGRSFETLNKVFDGNITMDPMVALLGLLPKEIKVRAKKYV